MSYLGAPRFAVMLVWLVIALFTIVDADSQPEDDEKRCANAQELLVHFHPNKTSLELEVLLESAFPICKHNETFTPSTATTHHVVKLPTSMSLVHHSEGKPPKTFAIEISRMHTARWILLLYIIAILVEPATILLLALLGSLYLRANVHTLIAVLNDGDAGTRRISEQ